MFASRFLWGVHPLRTVGRTCGEEKVDPNQIENIYTGHFEDWLNGRACELLVASQR